MTKTPSEHKCNTCFYGSFDKNVQPCVVCEGYNKYVNVNVFSSDYTKISTWQDEDAFEVKEPKKNDAVNSPAERKLEDNVFSPKHYTAGKYEVIDVIEDWGLNFRLANTIKYIARHMHKGKPLEDLEKALWYLQREVDTWKSPSKN